MTHNLPHNQGYRHAGGVWDMYGSIWRQMSDQWNDSVPFSGFTSNWGSRWHATFMILRDHLKGMK